jgi:hypothetical protein
MLLVVALTAVDIVVAIFLAALSEVAIAIPFVFTEPTETVISVYNYSFCFFKASALSFYCCSYIFFL